MLGIPANYDLPETPPLLVSPALFFGRSSAAVVHRYFTKEMLRRFRKMGRLRELLDAQLQWLKSLGVVSARQVRLNGSTVRKRTGKSKRRQRFEVRWLALWHSIPPKSYYMFRLYEPAQRRRASEFLHRFETKKRGIFLFLNRRVGADREFLRDKRLFFEECGRVAVTNAPVLLEFRDGQGEFVVHPGPGLPEADLIVKPRHGKGGGGVERYEFREGRFFGADSDPIPGNELWELLEERSRETPLLVQPRLHNHPELADLGGGALTTVRIITILNEAGRAEATDASFRVPVGNAVVDNMHRGGVAAAVDLPTGRVGRAIALSSESDWLEKHPESGASIAGRVLPRWRETIDLVCRAHDAFSPVVLVGWDIGLLEDGPCIVEGNSAPCVNLVQRPLGGPIGCSRFGDLLAHHIRELEPWRVVRRRRRHRQRGRSQQQGREKQR